MQYIKTRYFGPTNHRGSRIKAGGSGEGAPSIMVPYDYGIGQDDNHIAAAKAFAEKFNWSGVWYGGDDNRGCVFVRVMHSHQSAFTVKDTGQ